MGNKDETSRLEFEKFLDRSSTLWSENALFLQFRNEEGWDYKQVLLEGIRTMIYHDLWLPVALEIREPQETLSLESQGP